jgi:hypothetical protein
MQKRFFVLFVLFALPLFSCLPFNRSLVPSSSTDLGPKRYLKVALFVEDEKNPNPQLFKAVQEAFTSLSKKTGIDVGGFTLIRMDFSGIITQRQVYRRLYEIYAPMISYAFDIGLCYAPRLYVEDVFALVGGPLVLGSADITTGRFAVFRVLDPSIIEHEISHLFCAMDWNSPEENLKQVLAHKNRKFDGRYLGMCKNFELRYPDATPENPWGEKEYQKVVERAKERAKQFELKK